MYRTTRVKRLAGILFAGCLALLSSDASACLVCVPFPEETVTDRLLRADVVVLAREDADRSFSYAAVERLKGEIPDVPINLFVDSATRRRLALNPDQYVVLAFEHRTGNWASAGYATAAYRKLVEAILARETDWESLAGTQDRAQFFLPYLAHEEPSLRMLAYLEVGQSSYDTIRQADAFVPAGQVYQFLDDPRYLEWQRLYILLLGVNAGEREKQLIRSELQNRAEFNRTLNLSAWATALIEIDGEQAINWLEANYLGMPGRDADAVLEVVKALSVHGALKFSKLRRRIATSYAVLIQTHPSLAGWAARDLAAWQDWRLADRFAEIRASQPVMESSAAYAIDYYLGRAGKTP